MGVLFEISPGGVVDRQSVILGVSTQHPPLLIAEYC